MKVLETFATFVTNDDHHNLFRKGPLVEEWAATYPMLFDADDIRIAQNQRHLGYHYHEWLAAVLLFHTTGFLSLIEAYAYKSHVRKRQVLEKLATGEALDLITSTGISNATQCPDLLVYDPKSLEWFFCEVKGPQDRIRNSQQQFFEKLSQVTGKDIKVVHFRTNP